jgi:superfamily II RNA helicase
MTTEIFRNAILVNPEEFEHRDWVIFDEIHYLDDIERGTVWEEAIILLPKHMRMLALSATIPNIDEFVGWLGKVHHFTVKVVTEKTRPVPLHFMFQCHNKILENFSRLKDSRLLGKMRSKNWREDETPAKINRLNALAGFLKANNMYPCVYFSFSRRRCENLAEDARDFDLLTKDECEKITALFENLVKKFDVSSEHINYLYPLVKRGIAYHHAGLLPTLKEIIEQLFTSGLIKLIFTTETFALGINMPARTVVFDGMTKFYGHQFNYLRTRDFYQMAGRAGRRGIDTEGFVISRVSPSSIDLPSLETIIYGGYEPIKSQLNSCYATILNLYKIMGQRIYDIYPKSFHFHQARLFEQKEIQGLLKRKISLLQNLKYIVGSGISPKAELAAQVYSFELAVGELFENGYLDTLDEESLFIVITALVYEPRKNDQRPPNDKSTKRLKKYLLNFMQTIHNREQQYQIFPLSKTFYFHLSAIAKAWYGGAEFASLTKICNIDEGEIVRYFRMSIQVLKEMRVSSIIDEKLKIKISNCLERINRDEINAERQLRQEI